MATKRTVEVMFWAVKLSAPFVDRRKVGRPAEETAPVNTMGDVLLKLERIAHTEDLEAEPHLITNRILLNLQRDLRATDAAYSQLSATEAARRPCPTALPPNTPDDLSVASTLDLKAIHAAADAEVDQIYSLQGRMTGGRLTLKQLTETARKGDAEQSLYRTASKEHHDGFARSAVRNPHLTSV